MLLQDAPQLLAERRRAFCIVQLRPSTQRPAVRPVSSQLIALPPIALGLTVSFALVSSSRQGGQRRALQLRRRWPWVPVMPRVKE